VYCKTCVWDAKTGCKTYMLDAMCNANDACIATTDVLQGHICFTAISIAQSQSDSCTSTYVCVLRGLCVYMYTCEVDVLWRVSLLLA